MVSGRRLIFQCFRITLGLILAFVAAGIFLAWGFFQASQPQAETIRFAAMIGTGLVTASAIGSAAFTPAIFLVLLAEVFRWRAMFYHVGGAGLIALGLWALGSPPGDGGGLRPGTPIALAGGFLAGAVYWVIAGISSGSWRLPEHPDRPGDRVDLGD